MSTTGLADNPFFFIHVPKTAGTSIMLALSYDHHGEQHRTAAEAIAEIGAEPWFARWSFAFVRNPWDRAVSWYWYHRERFSALAEYSLDFARWVLAGMQTHWDGIKPAWSQAYWLTYDGRPAVQSVYRYESLADAGGDVQQRLGRCIPLSCYNSSARERDWRRYYNAQTERIVGDICGRDIELYGYRFEAVAGSVQP